MGRIKPAQERGGGERSGIQVAVDSLVNVDTVKPLATVAPAPRLAPSNCVLP